MAGLAPKLGSILDICPQNAPFEEQIEGSRKPNKCSSALRSIFSLLVLTAPIIQPPEPKPLEIECFLKQ
jgi:hypothetical protein